MPGSVTKACADESIGLKELRELPRFVGVKHLLILKMLFWKEPQSSFCMPDVTGTFSLCFSFSMVEKRTKKSLQKQCWNRHFFSSHSWCLKHPGFSKYQAWDQIGYGQTVKRKLLTPLPPFCPTKSASVLITSVSAAWWASWPRFHKAVLWAKDWLKDHCMPLFFFLRDSTTVVCDVHIQGIREFYIKNQNCMWATVWRRVLYSKSPFVASKWPLQTRTSQPSLVA